MKELLKNSERTEEIQAIIERMPGRFGIYITFLVLVLIIALGIFGWIIRYPDIVTGQIVINTDNSSIKLIANSSGRLSLIAFRSQDNVKEGDYIAVIENAANLEDIFKVLKLVKNFDINSNTELMNFPRNISLGDLNTKYFTFINAFEQFEIYRKENVLTKQEAIFKKLLIEQKEVLNVSLRKLEMSNENVRLTEKFYKRDSILFSKKVLTEAEFDKSQMTEISVKDAYHTMLNNITSIKEQIEETNNKIQQTIIQKSEKENQTRLDLIASYVDLSDYLKTWEQKYVFKSPVKGKVQFLKFWTKDQFIQAGEPAFTIVPLRSKIIGQMTLPSSGAGKVRQGQEVVIKLDDYPYVEYGSIKGKISSLSLTSNPIKTEKGNIETYLAKVDLPDQLKTNYGSKLDFKFEMKGTGEIIVRDKRLVERLFDNLRYAVNK
jgi:multidrug resistance efflux pump